MRTSGPWLLVALVPLAACHGGSGTGTSGEQRGGTESSATVGGSGPTGDRSGASGRERRQTRNGLGTSGEEQGGTASSPTLGGPGPGGPTNEPGGQAGSPGTQR